jgi:hypothetical protein
MSRNPTAPSPAPAPTTTASTVSPPGSRATKRASRSRPPQRTRGPYRLIGPPDQIAGSDRLGLSDQFARRPAVRPVSRPFGWSVSHHYLSGQVGQAGRVGSEASTSERAAPQPNDDGERARPGVALVGLGASSQHALDLIDKIVPEAACPVIALVHESEPGFVRKPPNAACLPTSHTMMSRTGRARSTPPAPPCRTPRPTGPVRPARVTHASSHRADHWTCGDRR